MQAADKQKIASGRFFSNSEEKNQPTPQANDTINTANISDADNQSKQNRVVIYRTRNGEPRSKRTLISLTPTDFENVKKRADQIGISMNEYINRLVQNDLYGNFKK